MALYLPLMKQGFSQWIINFFAGVDSESNTHAIETSIDICLEDYKPRRVREFIEKEPEFWEEYSSVSIWIHYASSIGVVSINGKEIGRLPDQFVLRIIKNKNKGDYIDARIIDATEERCIIRCTPK